MPKIDHRHENSGRFPFTEGGPGCRKNLIAARLERGQSQDELAKLVGCSQEQYSLMESNKRDGRRYWSTLAYIFGIAPDDMEEFMSPCEEDPKFGWTKRKKKGE